MTNKQDLALIQSQIDTVVGFTRILLAGKKQEDTNNKIILNNVAQECIESHEKPSCNTSAYYACVEEL